MHILQGCPKLSQAVQLIALGQEIDFDSSHLHRCALALEDRGYSLQEIGAVEAELSSIPLEEFRNLVDGSIDWKLLSPITSKVLNTIYEGLLDEEY